MYRSGDGGVHICQLKATGAKPVLRLGLPFAAFDMEYYGRSTGINTAMLGTAFSMKIAWNTGADFLPVSAGKRQDFDIEFYGFTENLSLATARAEGGFERVGPSHVKSGLQALAGASGTDYARQNQIREVPAGLSPHALLGGFSSAYDERTLARAGGEFQTPILGWYVYEIN